MIKELNYGSNIKLEKKIRSIRAHNSILSVNLSYIISIILFSDLYNISIIGSFNKYIHFLCECVCMFFALQNVKKKYRRNTKIFVIAICFFIGVIISTELFGSDGYIKAALRFIFKISTFFLTCNVLAGNQKKYLIDGGLTISLFFVLLNDILMFVFPEQFYGRNDNFIIGTFFLGNKFNVSYAHLFLFLFIVMHLKQDKWYLIKVWILNIFLIIICLYVKCTTMAVGSLILLFVMLFPNFLKKILVNKVTFFVIYVASGAFVLLFSIILQIPFIRFIIVNVLHRSLTLTGRSNIYIILYDLAEKSLWFGYGYESTIVEKVTFDGWHGYGNSQNAMWDIIINYGLIGLVFFTFLTFTIVFLAIKTVKRKENELLEILIIFIEILMIMGCVEVTYRDDFFILLAIINAIYLHIYPKSKRFTRWKKIILNNDRGINVE